MFEMFYTYIHVHERLLITVCDIYTLFMLYLYSFVIIIKLIVFSKKKQSP